jgi:hypothetical protein
MLNNPQHYMKQQHSPSLPTQADSRNYGTYNSINRYHMQQSDKHFASTELDFRPDQHPLYSNIRVEETRCKADCSTYPCYRESDSRGDTELLPQSSPSIQYSTRDSHPYPYTHNNTCQCRPPCCEGMVQRPFSRHKIAASLPIVSLDAHHYQFSHSHAQVSHQVEYRDSYLDSYHHSPSRGDIYPCQRNYSSSPRALPHFQPVPNSRLQPFSVVQSHIHLQTSVNHVPSNILVEPPEDLNSQEHPNCLSRSHSSYKSLDINVPYQQLENNPTYSQYSAPIMSAHLDTGTLTVL